MAGYIGKSQGVTQVDGYNKTEADNKFVEGDDTLYVDETNNRVGVGTSSPSALLEVYGDDVDSYITANSNQNWSGLQFQDSGTTKAAFYMNHLSAYLRCDVNGSERMRIDSSGNVGIGTSSPSTPLHTLGSGVARSEIAKFEHQGQRTLTIEGQWGGYDIGPNNGTLFHSSGGNIGFRCADSGDADILLQSNGNVGIGTSSPSNLLHISGTSGTPLLLERTNGAACTIAFKGNTTTNNPYLGANGDNLYFNTASSEAMRIDSSGNLLVGKTSGSISTAGTAVFGGSNVGLIESASAGRVMTLNRLSSDGEIISLRKDGSTVGDIGVDTGRIYIGSSDTGLFFDNDNDRIRPYNTVDNSIRDNRIDLGSPDARFEDIYATNGTIQTSDRNEKQDIASLTKAEMRVAKRISAMFKKFRWIDSVEEKGDSARTHTGVIAQDVQQAFADESLDAGDYALFISTTWWETQTEVPAVEAVDEVVDEEGNVITEAVEAKEAYTRIDTYDTAEEAPEGATERTRMGIRYPQLLSFLAAYNEQRFADIEARLDALEAN